MNHREMKVLELAKRRGAVRERRKHLRTVARRGVARGHHGDRPRAEGCLTQMLDYKKVRLGTKPICCAPTEWCGTPRIWAKERDAQQSPMKRYYKMSKANNIMQENVCSSNPQCFHCPRPCQTIGMSTRRDTRHNTICGQQCTIRVQTDFVLSSS